MGLAASRIGAEAPRIGAAAPRGGCLTARRSAGVALAALAIAWTSAFVIVGAALALSGADAVAGGPTAAALAAAGMASAYCGALVALVRESIRPVALASAWITVAGGQAGGVAAPAMLAAVAVTAVALRYGVDARPRHALAPRGAAVAFGAGASLLVAAFVAAPRAHYATTARQVVRAQAPPAPVPAPAPTPTPGPEPPVTSVIADYYRALDAHRFAAAWPRLSPAVRRSFGGFDAWRRGYATTITSRPLALHVVGAGHVRHVLEAVDRTPCGTRTARFSVDWRLVRTAAGWRAASLTATTLPGTRETACR